MTMVAMRAIITPRWGDADVLTEAEVPAPRPGPTELLVRVRAAGVNPVDFKTRAGGGISGLLDGPPVILGWDVAGVVEAVGEGVTLFAPGDEVFGMPRFPLPAAAYAEYVTAPSRQFAHQPATLSAVEAGGLPLAGLTAWQAVVDTAAVQPGERVLVTAASGGVGHLAVQIAKARGAYVIGSGRAVKHEFLRAIGADEVVDYTRTGLDTAVRDADVVIDTFGGDHAALLPTLRDGGRLVTIVYDDLAPVAAAAAGRSITVSGVLVEPDRIGLLGLAALVDEGRLRVAVDTTLPLAQAAKAHQIGERGQTTGKIVLTVE
jgi:NADPH:quinone reductase-like Zn-dependent oxidoreductase